MNIALLVSLLLIFLSIVALIYLYLTNEKNKNVKRMNEFNEIKQEFISMQTVEQYSPPKQNKKTGEQSKEVKHLTDERLKIWIDLFKWIIVSVVLFLITTKIDEGFRDREINIKETAHYDTYMNYIISTEKIAERRELAQFLSVITVSEPIRERWKEYFDITDKIYNKYLKERNEINDTISKTREHLDSLNFLRDMNSKQLEITKAKFAELDKRVRFLNDQITITKDKDSSLTKIQSKNLSVPDLKDVEYEKLLMKNPWEIVHKNVFIENNLILFKANKKLEDIGKSKDIDSNSSFWEVKKGMLIIKLNNGYSTLTANIKDQDLKGVIEGEANTKISNWIWTMRIKN